MNNSHTEKNTNPFSPVVAPDRGCGQPTVALFSHVLHQLFCRGLGGFTEGAHQGQHLGPKDRDFGPKENLLDQIYKFISNL